MKTEIRFFCEQYTESLNPFSQELRSALSRLPENGNAPEVDRWSLRLREVRHRADALTGKIAEQQAYLLIFGPLKSGKSTLMNAVSGTYVSEVSSLPAYPALVYVKHSDKQAFKATTYAGEQIQFEDSLSMSKAVEQGHEALAAKILEVEKTGESFDPQLHYPEAIRRMDVETPAQSLAESGSVLVDTPGLYTRMRFGYDAMTRDFRDNASCAIFVVKSDNLFFEKVFEEFNELLGHFSRIFLVVNIDSSKRDLSADGSLEPSMESRRPETIIEAFQSLAMSAPLREAFDQGRLNVYPIDLLMAASHQLKRNLDEKGDQGGEDSESGENPMADDGVSQETDNGFNRFLNDLTDYLNSSDYLREFMQDSLRAGKTMQSEVASIVSNEAPENLKVSEQKWVKQLEEAQTKLTALGTLKKLNWDEAFKSIHQEKDRLLGERSKQYSNKLRGALKDSLDQWMESDDSLKDLQDKYLNAHIGKESSNDAKAILQKLHSLMDTREGGARFPVKESQALEQAGLRFYPTVQRLLENLGGGEEPDAMRFELKPEEVDLKRTFLDYLLFRTNKSIRLKFFGPDGTNEIPTHLKWKRITEPQLEALRALIIDYPETVLPQVQQEYIDRILQGYVSELQRELNQQREKLEADLTRKVSECQKALEHNRKVQKIFSDLSTTTESFECSIVELATRFEVSSESLDPQIEAGEGDDDEDGQAFGEVDQPSLKEGEEERHPNGYREPLERSISSQNSGDRFGGVS